MKKTLILSMILGVTSFAAAQTDTSSTQQTGGTDQTNVPAAPAGADLPANLTAAQYFELAQQAAAQAEIAYPQAFVDRVLWKRAVTAAAMAANMEPGERQFQSYEAQLYTKTQWWINAYNSWMQLDNLTDAEAEMAAMSAAKLAYLSLQRGDREAARTYITQGMQFKNTQSLQDLMRRL